MSKEEVSSPQKGSIEPDLIRIPDEYGFITQTYKGTNNKLIIHIQDAHSNYEAQKNEAEILKSLIENYNLKLILVEGKVSNRNFHYIRPRAPLEERIRKADELLKNGDITGVNYLDIASDLPMVIQGIENRKLYDEHREAFWEIDKFKDIGLDYINRLIHIADLIKPKIYNAELIELDAKRKDCNDEKLDLVDYYIWLYNKAVEKDFPVYTFPNIENLAKASELEKKIDMAKIANFTASDEEMRIHNEYMNLLRNLNIDEMFREGSLLETTIEDISSESLDQKRLLKVTRALSIIKNFLTIKAVPEEYSYFLKNKKDFDPLVWVDFLSSKIKGLGLSIDMPENYYVIKDNLQKLERFYDLAFKRDEIFMKRTTEHLENEKVDMAALVAGGFHTPMLTRLLKDAGYSYVVVSPRVTTETDEEIYRAALKSEWLAEIKEME